MIVEAILSFFVSIIGGLLNLLPAWTPVDLSGMTADLSAGPVGTIFSGLGWLNYYVPIDTMWQLLVMLFAIWAVSYVVRFLIWVLQLFHIAGGG